MEILKCENVRKVYGFGDSQVTALDGIDLSVSKGEFVSVVGASGPTSHDGFWGIFSDNSKSFL